MTSGSWGRERRFAVPRLLPRRLRSPHTLVLILTLGLVGWLGWTWYRGSSFVKVEKVTVTGLSGPDMGQIRDNLTSAALTMTTLNVSLARLVASVSQYGYVQRLAVTSAGSHDLVIHVDEQVPVALVQISGQTQVVDADGRLLPSTTTHGVLPTVPLAGAPAGQTITAPGARSAIAALAAAPYALLAHIAGATSSSAHGVIVQLRNGPQVYFGAASQLGQKWAAVVAVLQDKGSAGASYIDVTDPRRPATGSGVSAQQATDLGLETSSTGPALGASGSTTSGSGANATNTVAAGG